MCPGPDTGTLILIMLFLLCLMAAPIVVIAALVYDWRRRRAERLLRILD